MNPAASTLPTRSNEDRLERIESALAHLQHDVDGLNVSLLNQLRRLQEFESRFLRLESELQVESDPREHGQADSERPPHY